MPCFRLLKSSFPLQQRGRGWYGSDCLVAAQMSVQAINPRFVLCHLQQLEVQGHKPSIKARLWLLKLLFKTSKIVLKSGRTMQATGGVFKQSANQTLYLHTAGASNCQKFSQPVKFARADGFGWLLIENE